MEEPENGSELRRHYLLSHPLLMKPNDATGEPDGWTPMAGTLLQTKATTIRKLYDDVVKRLLKGCIIEQECELLNIWHERPKTHTNPSVWVCLWDARDPNCDKEIPPEFIRDDTNLYFVVEERHGELHHDNTIYDNTS